MRSERFSGAQVVLGGVLRDTGADQRFFVDKRQDL
ncbi:hypothetical protein MSS2_03874 [Mycobacterium marinum]|nr:hypothetical protein VIMS_01642 [Mycobacterium marinum]RFZ50284.1 hypothetical protein MSS2_03874 [Mycobacterium marinum]